MLCSNYMHYRKKSKDHKLTWLQSVQEKVPSMYENSVMGNLHYQITQSRLPSFFIIKYSALLHQGDKSRVTWQNDTEHLFPYQLLRHLLFLTAHYIFGCLNYFCEYHHNLWPHLAFTIELMDSAWPKKQLPFIRWFCVMPLGQKRVYDFFFSLSFPGTNATLVF